MMAQNSLSAMMSGQSNNASQVTGNITAAMNMMNNINSVNPDVKAQVKKTKKAMQAIAKKADNLVKACVQT